MRANGQRFFRLFSSRLLGRRLRGCRCLARLLLLFLARNLGGALHPAGMRVLLDGLFHLGLRLGRGFGFFLAGLLFGLGFCLGFLGLLFLLDRGALLAPQAVAPLPPVQGRLRVPIDAVPAQGGRFHRMQQKAVVPKGLEPFHRRLMRLFLFYGTIEHLVLVQQHLGRERLGCIRARFHHFEAAVLRQLANHVRIDRVLVSFSLLRGVVAVLPHLHQFLAVAGELDSAQAAGLAHPFLKSALLPLVRHDAQAAFVGKIFRSAVKNIPLAGTKRYDAENDALPVVLLYIGKRDGTVDLLHTLTPYIISVCPWHGKIMNEP